MSNVKKQKGWKEKITKAHKETFWGVGYAHYLDCSVGFTGT